MPEYTDAILADAVQAVLKGYSIKRAARTFNVPRSTLQGRLHGRLTRHEAAEPLQKLSRVQEAHLASWVLLQADLGLPPTHQEIRFFAEMILKESGGTAPFGKRWIGRFLARHPSLGVLKPKRMETVRINGAITKVIREWWPYLLIPAVAEIEPQHRYNMDEAGLMEG